MSRITTADLIAGQSLPDSLLLDERQASRLLSVSVATLRKWRYDGNGPRLTRLGRSVRYRRSDVDAFVNALPTFGSNAEAYAASIGGGQ